MTQKSPDRDTTIKDIHTTRRRIADKFGHHLAVIIEDAQKRQSASGYEINDRPDLRVPDVMTPGDVCHRSQNRRHHSQSWTCAQSITAFKPPE
jgi:hypothetical protein